MHSEHLPGTTSLSTLVLRHFPSTVWTGTETDTQSHSQSPYHAAAVGMGNYFLVLALYLLVSTK